MQNEYIYKNKVSFCPECGASLKENSLYCPACGINLAGLNERHNRLTNFQKSEADIRKAKEKQENIEKTLEKESKKASRGVIYIILGAIIALLLIIYVPAFIEEATANNNDVPLEAYGYKAMEGLSAEDYLLNNPEQMTIKITEIPAEFIQHNQESEKTKTHSINVSFSFDGETQQTMAEYLLTFDENSSFKVTHITSFEEMFLPEYDGLNRTTSYYDDGAVFTWRIDAPLTNGSIYSGYSGDFRYSIIKCENDAGLEGALNTLASANDYYTKNNYIKHIKNITVQYVDETEREFACFATDDYEGVGVQMRLISSLGDGYYFMMQLPPFEIEGEDEFMNIIDRYLNIKIERAVQD